MSNINLLPPEYKAEISQAKNNKKALDFLLKSTGFVFIIAFFLLGAIFYFSNAGRAANQELTASYEEMEEFGNLKDESLKISERLGTIKQIEQSTNKWSGVIEEIQRIMPSGIYLNSFKMDANQKTRGQVTGSALSKKEVASLRDLMEKSEKFEYVDIETSSTVNDPKTKREIESFSLSFSLQKGALK